MLLAGDIGGTKTVLALFTQENGPHHALVLTRFESDKYPSLEAIVKKFLTNNNAILSAVDLGAAVFGIAGPVRNRRVQVTNLPWTVDADSLEEVVGAPVTLINDLEAIANAIPYLMDEDVFLLRPGHAEDKKPIAIIAPGTGLGEAFLVWSGTHYQALPSEGGHTDYAPATPLELELLTFLQPRLGHVSYERVCSGIGIPNLYAFVKEHGRYPEPPWLAEALADAEDQTPFIVDGAQQKEEPICLATLDLFMAILGSEAGNLVLQLLATGGVYLAGGIPPRILPQLKSGTFEEAFLRKGRFTGLLQTIPIYVVTDSLAALYGTAGFGLRLLESE
ncbi:MAG: glucokinase [Candidatus Promineifilaceae bacterium]